ncbi:MAG: hypothetical protein A2580_18130 [Hydrogenophilales bacterium RIFOXYD1_FULL_62_11]|nr:MAG: hypothetical protein A2580_18130 [Hydrogenophilales bacterium RIFOXYD1_FULL_62_11]
MQSAPSLPSTLDGLKRQAKTLRRSNADLTHAEALDRVARMMGFNNYPDAQRRLSLVAPRPTPVYEAFLSAYWRERTTARPRPMGLETLRVQLSKPLASLLSRHEVDSARNLEHFRLVEEDHLERRGDLMLDQIDVRHSLGRSARTLLFLQATGLRPATTRAQRKAWGADPLPERDHYSFWIDPSTNGVVMLDEPYPHVDVQARAKWAAARGMQILAPDWDGLYSPGNSKPYLVGKDGELLKRLAAALEVPDLFSKTSWMGTSLPYRDRFVSPARRAKGKPASARTMPAYRGSVRAGAIAYGGEPGYKGKWRPEVPMPFELHEQASKILQGTSFNDVPIRGANLIDQVRSDLEDWVLAEHPLLMDQRHDIYYGGRAETLSTDARGALVRLKMILEEGYADCPPRRQMLQKIEKVLSMMDR